jgi:UDP-glucose 4-epimerase
MSAIFVVGGAGFIGSHLVDALALQHDVTVFDDFSVGRREFLSGALTTGRVRVVEGDARNVDQVRDAMAGHEVVIHLAANPEARRGLSDTRLDLELGLHTTLAVAEAARLLAVRRLFFASSGTVYGDQPQPMRETDLGSLPISLYGASKLASESFLSAFSSCFAMDVCVLRFGNVVGARATHGVILDFLNKLTVTPDALEVLGDGRQEKPYLHVSDCVRGIQHLVAKQPPGFETFNLAPATTTTVARIAELCVAASPRPSAQIRPSGGARGWAGDVPVTRLNPAKLREFGFEVLRSSDEAVELAVRELRAEVFGR